MKKFLALLLVMMLIMTSFTACGSKDDAEVETPDTNLEQDVESGDEEANADAEAEADTEEEGEADADTEGEADADQEEESVKEEEKEEEKPADKKEESKPASSEKPSNSNDTSSSSGKTEAKAPSGTPAEIIDKIYEKAPAVEFPLGTMEVDLADLDALKMFTGLSSAEKIESAAVSEAMMGSQAYSLIVVKAKDAKYSADVMEEMVNGIDQRKWICVEADDLSAAAMGNVVVMMMVSSEYAETITSKDVIDAFSAVCGGLDARA